MTGSEGDLPESLSDRDAMWRENVANFRAALRMIREAVETLGPVAALPSEEAVVTLYGPEPVHEAQAIVDAIGRWAGDRA